MTAGPLATLISCEHGGNSVPEELRDWFATREAAQHLSSHRGYDPGALRAAQSLAHDLQAPLEYSTVSRLVVDLNRSLESPELFSKFVRDRDPLARQRILETYYHPYRKRVTSRVAGWAQAQSVLHLSVHTFTPRFRGQVRPFDIGVLFDPARRFETEWSMQLIEQLSLRGFRAFPNRPYEGIADGLTTALREPFPEHRYAGIELEINNRFAKLSAAYQEKWCQRITAAIQAACSLTP